MFTLEPGRESWRVCSLRAMCSQERLGDAPDGLVFALSENNMKRERPEGLVNILPSDNMSSEFFLSFLFVI